MLSAIRKQLNPATVMAFVALVFAMTGGAFAVTGHGGGSGSGSHATLTATVAKAKKKDKSAPVGKPGPRGPAGPAGTAGSQGPAGPAGAQGPAGGKGENGTAGTNGTAGANGASVTSAPLGVGDEHCKAGGSEFSSASGPSYACNGKEGKEGKEGSPWTVGGTLPPEKTETGSWAIGVTPFGVSSARVLVPLSFPIPLKERLNGEGCEEERATRTKPCHVHFINEGGEEVDIFHGGAIAGAATECGTPIGTAAEPKASPGNLCVYMAHNTGDAGGGIDEPGSTRAEPGASTTGAVLKIAVNEEGSEAWGTWAVTEK
jgi:hypothetical protein